jgi:hypothetical protein
MAVAAPLALAATGLSAAGSLFQGYRASEGAEAQAQAATDAAEVGRIRAAQTSGDMTRKLTSSLSNILAIRAGAGLDPASPTGAAIRANVQGRGDENRTMAVDNINAQVKADENASAFYQQSASDALLGGFLGAAGSMFKGLSGGMAA